MLYEGFGYYCSPGNKVTTPTWGSLKAIHPREVFLRHSFRDSVGRCISPSLQLAIWCCHPTQQWPFKNVLTLKVLSLYNKPLMTEGKSYVSQESQCFSERSRGKHRDKTVHSPLFFRKIVEIEKFSSRAAIFDDSSKMAACNANRSISTILRKNGRLNSLHRDSRETKLTVSRRTSL